MVCALCSFLFILGEHLAASYLYLITFISVLTFIQKQRFTLWFLFYMSDDLQPKEVRKQGVYNQCFVILEIY